MTRLPATDISLQLACALITFAPLRRQEIGILESLGGHPRLLRYLGSCHFQGRIALVSELCEGGDLFTALRRDSIRWSARWAVIAC